MMDNSARLWSIAGVVQGVLNPAAVAQQQMAPKPAGLNLTQQEIGEVVNVNLKEVTGCFQDKWKAVLVRYSSAISNQHLILLITSRCHTRIYKAGYGSGVNARNEINHYINAVSQGPCEASLRSICP